MEFLRLLDRHGGECIGEIRMPEAWVCEIRRDRRLVRMLQDPPPMPMGISIFDFDPTAALTIHRVQIEESFDAQGRYSVVLFGVTPEQFPEIPGCWFYPTVAYLRRGIAEAFTEALKRHEEKANG